jgi:hypothetical protein
MGEAGADALTVTVIVPSQLFVMVAREAVFTIAACTGLQALLADTATPVPVEVMLAPVTAPPTPSVGTLLVVLGSVSLDFRFMLKVLVPVMVHAVPMVMELVALTYVQDSATAVGAESIAKVTSAPVVGRLN